MQHLHEVLLVSHGVPLLLPGRPVARPPPELVPGLEMLSLSLVLLLLPGSPGVPLLLHLPGQLVPVLRLVPLQAQRLKYLQNLNKISNLVQMGSFPSLK